MRLEGLGGNVSNGVITEAEGAAGIQGEGDVGGNRRRAVVHRPGC